MERWQKLEELFERAVELSPDDRRRLLDDECAGNDELREELQELLRADETVGDPVGDVIEKAARRVAADGDGAEALRQGESLGPYRLIDVLGRGGMSTVFRADRSDDQFSKEVAVKVLRSGLLGAETLERFRQERQILADLEHPNIARLLDGGARDDGTPYVVMELVEGLPIDEYARRHELTLGARLALFRKVCAAVQYAHQRLVVHRDLKPSNILVQEDGTPKLLDFGIAKLLDSEGPAVTVTARTWMTPEYASPEQVRGERVSTASDVYSLGAILYELLTERRPYELSARSAAEIERVVCETVPPLPSHVVTSARRTPETETTPSVPARRLRGDLDNIVLMALRKEAERRYGSAGELADDLERFERGLPVRSRADTLGYRSRKFVGRHRFSVAAGALLVLLLSIFSVLMYRQSVALARERDTANLERDKARRVSRFMSELLTTTDDAGVVAGDLTARQILDRGAEKLETQQLADQPEIRAALLSAVGDVYLFHDQAERAEALFQEAHRLRLAELGELHLETAQSYTALGHIALRAGDREEAEKLFRKALELRRQLAGDRTTETAESMADLARVLTDNGDFEQAYDYFRGALDRYREHRGDADPTTLEIKQRFARSVGALGRTDEQLELAREVLADSIELYGEDHLRVGQASADVARFLKNDNRFEEAEPHYLRALEISRKHLGVHAETAVALNNYGIFLRAKGSEAKAGPVLEEALEMYYEVYGREHPTVAIVVGNYASWHRDNGSLDQAAPLYEKSLALFSISPGSGHWITASIRANYAACMILQGKEQEGEAALEEAVEILLEQHPKHRRAKEAVDHLVSWYRESDRPELATELEARAAPLMATPDSQN